MSGLQKRMRRKLLTDAARAQRKATAGAGQFRRPLNAWVWSTKADVVEAVTSSVRNIPPSTPADERSREVTAR